MNHLNDNLFCAIDTETTGLDYLQNEIIEIAVIPLDGALEVSRIHKIFHVTLKPDNLDAIQPDAVRVMKTYDNDMIDYTDMTASKEKIFAALASGIEQSRGEDLFNDWFHRLDLLPKKRIIPIAYNWPFDRDFIRQWLGATVFNDIFDSRHRDPLTIAQYFNDYCDMHNEPTVPFPKTKLTSICKRLGIRQERAHNALDDAYNTANVYKAMMTTNMISVPRTEIVEF